jgi:phospholipid/cholesterol/gamma-HCH transport system permease protein
LATMKTGEEIDALRAWGVDPIDHLVLPRVLALLLVAPLVWAYGALVGVLAGVVPTSWVYGVPPVEYLNQALSALTWTHLWVGLFKCVVYAALLGLAGCREGLHAGRNAQAVGEATTRAVVKGLVWIIAAACFSTVVLQSLGL